MLGSARLLIRMPQFGLREVKFKETFTNASSRRTSMSQDVLNPDRFFDRSNVFKSFRPCLAGMQPKFHKPDSY